MRQEDIERFRAQTRALADIAGLIAEKVLRADAVAFRTGTVRGIE